MSRGESPDEIHFMIDAEPGEDFAIDLYLVKTNGEINKIDLVDDVGETVSLGIDQVRRIIKILNEERVI